jgi:hypothetical protein
MCVKPQLLRSPRQRDTAGVVRRQDGRHTSCNGTAAQEPAQVLQSPRSLANAASAGRHRVSPTG